MTVPCVLPAQTLFPATADFLNRETTTSGRARAKAVTVSVTAPPFMQLKEFRPRTVGDPKAEDFRG